MSLIKSGTHQPSISVGGKYRIKEVSPKETRAFQWRPYMARRRANGRAVNEILISAKAPKIPARIQYFFLKQNQLKMNISTQKREYCPKR